MPRRLGVAHVEARGREPVRGPDRVERAAAAVGDPDARLLPVPARLRIDPAAGRLAVIVDDWSVDSHVVDHRTRAGAPDDVGSPRVHAPCVEPQAVDDRVATLRTLDHRLGPADADEARGIIGKVELRLVRVERDQHAVRPELQRIGDAVPAGRQIDDTVCVDRALQRCGVVGSVVARRTERAGVRPFADRRQQRERGRRSGRGRGQRRHGDVGRGFPHFAHAGELQPVGEIGDAPLRALARYGPPAFAELRKHRRVHTDRIIEADLREHALFVGNDDAGAADILETDILAPQRVGIATVDLDPDRRVADRDVDQRQVDLMFADRGVALARELRIDQRELPSR